MANYCYNKLIVNGDKAAVESALKYIVNDSGEVDFNIAVPMPELMKVNDDFVQNKLSKLVEVPIEFYDSVKLVDLKSLLDEFSLTANNTEAPNWLSFTRVGITKIGIEKVLDMDPVTPWLNLDSDLVTNINAGLTYLLTHDEKDTKLYVPVLSNLINMYYYKYASVYCLNTYGAEDWFSWSILNWGTKWNPISVAITTDDPVFIFDTAWCPPIEWFERLNDVLRSNDILVTIELYYAEPMCMFGGEEIRTVDGESASVNYTEEQILEFIGQDPDDKEVDITLPFS